MAKPTVLPGTKLLILVGNGASPEVFSAPCGLTTTGIDFSASSNTTVIPDCDNPEGAAWEDKDINGLSAGVTGNGVMAVESFAVWNDWFQGAAAKNIQIKLDDAALGHWAGSFILTGLKFGGVRGNKVTVDVTMANNGPVPWVAAT